MSLPGPYFDHIYEGSADPWSFRTRWYERRKRDATLAALPSDRYRVAFEPGCSIGVLTSALAARCDRLLAMDVSARALDEAAGAVGPNVELVRGAVPGDWPAGRFDLVVLSEVGYYLDTGDCRELARCSAGCAGDVVAVHWRHPVADYPLTGDQVHRQLDGVLTGAGMARLVSHVEQDFRLEVWSGDHRSVAARSGMVGI